MKIKRTLWVLVAVSALSAAPAPPADPGFTTPAAKAAQADHDKAMARAGDAYRKAVASADKAYVAKLDQMVKNPQVAKADGEAERLSEAKAKIEQQDIDLADTTMVLALVSRGATTSVGTTPAPTVKSKEAREVVPEDIFKLLPPHSASRPSAGGTTDGFKYFAERFALAWGKWGEACQNDTDAANRGSESTRITEIDKRSSDSLLHPVIWVVKVREVLQASTLVESSDDTFSFYWDGTRFVGLESQIVESYPEKARKSTLSADFIDTFAKIVQR